MSNAWNILLSSPSLWVAVCGIVLVAALGIVLRVFFSGRRRREQQIEDLRVDVKELGAHGPPEGVQLEYYGTPVRVALLVLAPAGRHHELPSKAALPAVVEQLIPGFVDILSQHQPAYRSWSAQISSSGFAHSFFNHVPLPGDRGRNTPWCSLAGKFNAMGQQFLVGIILVAKTVNGFSQRVVEHEGQWHDILRVRNRS